MIVKIEGRAVRTKKGVKGGSLDLRARKASSKKLCSAQAVTELRYLKMGVMDWSLCRKDWKKQRPRSKLQRQAR